MAINLISVGLSVMGSLRHPGRWLEDQPGLVDVITRERPHELRPGGAGGSVELSAWLSAAFASPAQLGDESARAAGLAVMVETVQPGRWPSIVSGELKTLARMPGTGYPLSRGDTAVLVCSDTTGGLLAGLWNAVALTSGDLSRVGYLARPDAPLGPVRGRALVVRVPGLDAGEEDGFRRAMGGLGTLGRNLLQSGELRQAEPILFCLTGGYKATMPYLIGLAEGLRSLDAGHPVDAFVTHETAGQQALPIRLPLRRLVASQVEQELSGFDASGERAAVPRPALLNGYAYDLADGRCTLTAFGEGLRALFGVSPERAGG
jgi:hypothetical protein